MISFPFFRFPYNYRYYSHNPYYLNTNNNYSNNSNYFGQNNNSNNTKINDEITDNINFKNNVNNENIDNRNEYKKKSSRYNTFNPLNINFSGFNDIEQPLLEVMGIKLYLDDIIILGLLFFLYNEGVKDDILFISLILLLLS